MSEQKEKGTGRRIAAVIAVIIIIIILLLLKSCMKCTPEQKPEVIIDVSPPMYSEGGGLATIAYGPLEAEKEFMKKEKRKKVGGEILPGLRFNCLGLLRY